MVELHKLQLPEIAADAAPTKRKNIENLTMANKAILSCLYLLINYLQQLQRKLCKLTSSSAINIIK